MALPIICIQICIFDGVSAVNHGIIAHINAAVGYPRGVIGALEKHQITGLGVGNGDGGADIADALGTEPPDVPAGMVHNPAYITGTVKRGLGTAAAPE